MLYQRMNQNIRNVRAFILTAAYNAPSNMDAYYAALVNFMI